MNQGWSYKVTINAQTKDTQKYDTVIKSGVVHYKWEQLANNSTYYAVVLPYLNGVADWTKASNAVTFTTQDFLAPTPTP
jgi:uncharacterized protein YcnI